MEYLLAIHACKRAIVSTSMIRDVILLPLMSPSMKMFPTFLRLLLLFEPLHLPPPRFSLYSSFLLIPFSGDLYYTIYSASYLAYLLWLSNSTITCDTYSSIFLLSTLHWSVYSFGYLLYDTRFPSILTCPHHHTTWSTSWWPSSTHCLAKGYSCLYPTSHSSFCFLWAPFSNLPHICSCRVLWVTTHTYHEALQVLEWKAAMDLEYHALVQRYMGLSITPHWC